MKVKIRSFQETDTSLIGMIENSIKRNWKFPAYTDYGTSVTYTYRDVACKIKGLHLLFADLGINPGDRIAICDKNSSNWAISFLAVLTYGAVVVPILSDFMTDSPKTVVSCPLTPDEVSYFRENPDDMALISYTSGSTGHSKGVMLPYRSLWSNVMFADEVLGLPQRCNTMALLPMAHMYGFAFDYLYESCIGCHVHYLTKTPSPAVVMKAFSDVKPAIFIAVPLIIEKIVTGKIFPILRTQRVRTLLKFPFTRILVYKQIRKRLIRAFGGDFYEIIVGGAALNKDVENFLAKIKGLHLLFAGCSTYGGEDRESVASEGSR